MYEMRKEEFAQVFCLMEESFPPEEHRPQKEQKALFENPEYKIYVLRDGQSGAVQAFLAVWDFGAWVYIEHFAVSPAYRNAGVGGKMLRDALEFFGGRVILEVEPPEDALTARRVSFYERNGFSLNRYPYTQPPISAGRRPIPLLFMTTGGEISREEFFHIRDLLYRRVYRVPESDALYAR